MRNPDRLPIRHKNLVIVKGDVRNIEEVTSAVKDVDAVLSVIGARSLKRSDQILTVAMESIVKAMKKQQVKRIAILTDCGLSDPRDHPSPLFRLGVRITELVMPPIVKDARRQTKILKGSGLEWTIVRVPFLTKGRGTGRYKAGYISRTSNIYVSRSDVADFMLNQVDDRQYAHAAPYICGTWPLTGY